MNTDFGDLLKKLRKDAKLTQVELAKEVNLHGSAISRYERGVMPDLRTLVAIINVLALTDQLERDKLDQLWEAATHNKSEFLKKTDADPLLELLIQQFEYLSGDEKTLLRNDIRNITELHQDFASSTKYRKEKQWLEAAGRLRSLRAKMDIRFQEWYLRVDEALGDCFYGGISFSEAVWHYELALMSAQQLKNLPKQGELLIKIGNVYRRRGGNDSLRALEHYYSEAKQIFIDLNNREWEAGCLRKMAGAWLFLGRPDEAEKLLDKSLAICAAEECGTGLYKCLQHKAWACAMLGRWDEAVNLCQSALKMIPESYIWDRIKGLRYLGDAFRLAQQLEEAEEIYEQSLHLVDSLKVQKSRTVGLIYLGLAKIYLKKDGQEGKAKELLEEGLKYHGGQGEDFRAIDFTVEQGCLLMKIGRLEEAEMRLNLARRQYSEQGNNFFHARTLALLSELYYKKEDGDKIKKLKENVDMGQQLDRGLINYFRGQIEFTYGIALMDDSQFEKAVDAWYSAMEKLLYFSPKFFNKYSLRLNAEIVRCSRNWGPQEAIKLGESYLRLWENKILLYQGNELGVIKKDMNKLQSELRNLQAQIPFD